MSSKKMPPLSLSNKEEGRKKGMIIVRKELIQRTKIQWTKPFRQFVPPSLEYSMHKPSFLYVDLMDQESKDATFRLKKVGMITITSITSDCVKWKSSQRKTSICGLIEHPLNAHPVTLPLKGQVISEYLNGFKTEGGSPIRTCLRNGSWSGNKVLYKGSACPPPQLLGHGYFQVNSSMISDSLNPLNSFSPNGFFN